MKFEYPVLIVLSVVGMMTMVSAGDLIVLYMGLELQSLALYVVAAFRRDSERSTEAGLKYFALGALSSGLLLYGASLTYGYAGTTSFAGIASVIGDGPLSTGLVFGLVFLAAGMAFKISAAPFHMWTPDVYEGSPTPVTAFFATAPKAAAAGDVRAGAVRRLRRGGGGLAADPGAAVGRVDVPRGGGGDRAAQLQAADGLLVDQPHGLRADGARGRDGRGGAGAADLSRDLRDDERRGLRLHPQHGARRQAGDRHLRARALQPAGAGAGGGAGGAAVQPRRGAAAGRLLREVLRADGGGARRGWSGSRSPGWWRA